ncbi:type VI secretion system Vgr family protein [Hymenobacter weizhouensis]|uniref:type VI secretion system Vgr family protein n=1 Tax=Hymenobacter sp. YIM 151500-1 TaxID=2987689 RepID=UPI0022275FAD|nr:type VI secretion system Vgr family protein [Hymenobacter sp. YIM 151500-1]UYZ62616.1 type VI secretion system Vgr family protein [Hymenobacter sp. YIM 151500-1]
MSRQITASIQCGGSLLAPAADLQQVTLRQNLFGHHEFEITVPFDNVEGAGVPFFSQAHKRLLGQPLSIEFTADSYYFNQGQKLLFKGLVTDLSTSKDTNYVGSIVAWGYSPCYLLTDGMKRRTFVKQTLASIFSMVLQAYPNNLLKHTVKPRHTSPIPFVAQYDETNFDFLSRLAAEYGEWFYYDGETLHLGAPATDEEVNFVADGAYNTFRFGLSLRPARAKLYDYSYQKNEKFNSSTKSQQVPGIQAHPFGSFALEQSEKLFADDLHVSAEMLIASASELDEEAKAMKATTAAELISFEGHSDNPSLRLGGVINVSGEGLGSRHITTESFGKYRIITISHQVDSEGNYSNNFTAIPHFLDVPPIRPGYNPPRGTPELAEVIDDKDPEKLGRLRVRYHWPVDNPKQAETDWIRLLTPYSGHGKGHLMKPEVGSQVLVGYQGGLAEQPFVLGNMFHANNQQGAKYSPDGNLMKGMQTAGGNKFVMQDKQGQQTILISNSNNKGTAIQVGFQGDGSVTIKSNGPVTVLGSTITLEAGDKGEIVMHAKNITMDADENMQLTAKQNIGLEAKDLALEVGNNMQAQISSNLNMKAGGQAKLISSDTDVI